jgi:SPP1 family predicted phage head-tail adaptor
VRAGLLDHKLVIQQRAPLDATYGALAQTWTTFATVWGQITERTGREYMAVESTQAMQTVVVTIRYLAGLRGDMRIMDENRVLQIIGIAMQGRRAWHVLSCTEFNEAAQ